jgi:hypothetical protein
MENNPEQRQKRTFKKRIFYLGASSKQLGVAFLSFGVDQQTIKQGKNTDVWQI